MMATTTPEFEDCMKFEDCRNCGKEIQYVMGSCRNCGAERPSNNLTLQIDKVSPLAAAT
jgi:predicted amidophosphoribosyltransferase